MEYHRLVPNLSYSTAQYYEAEDEGYQVARNYSKDYSLQYQQSNLLKRKPKKPSYRPVCRLSLISPPSRGQPNQENRRPSL